MTSHSMYSLTNRDLSQCRIIEVIGSVPVSLYPRLNPFIMHNNTIITIVPIDEGWYNMDIDSKDIERDGLMALAKEPKSNLQQNTANEHNQKITKAIKEVTSKHSKLLKKLAE